MKRIIITLACAILASCSGGAQEETYSYERKTDFDYGVKQTGGTSKTGYEIFVGSFADSDGDGYGDLNGIAGKLDYLKSLGTTYLWLTPVHPSHTYHHYDVEDYFAIAPQFGELSDFERLCSAAKAKGLKIVMDMVFNHASTRSELFQQALRDYVDDNRGDDSKADFFLFYDAMPKQTKEGQKFFSTSYGGMNVYYECDFDNSMADFNLDSAKVRAFHKQVMDYWIDKGAEGFRFDGVAYYYAAEPSKNLAYARYLADTAKEKKPDVFLISENWEKTSSYSRIASFAEAGQSAFNFRNSIDYSNYSVVSYVTQKNGQNFAKNVISLQEGILEKSTDIGPAFFLSNHDQDRVYNAASIWSSDKIELMKLTSSLYLLTPGTPFMYYGEEIGMKGIRGGANTDANRRLPMEWKSKGDNERCSDPEGTTYDEDGRVVEYALEAMEKGNSMVKHDAKVNQIRAEYPCIANGTYTLLKEAAEQKTLCAFSIAYKGDSYALVSNLDSQLGKVAFDDEYEVLDEVMTVGVPSKLSGKTLFIPEYSTVLLKKKAA